MSQKRVCYNCPDRKPGCHPTCEKYLAEKTEDARMKEIAEVERGALGYCYERTDKRRARRALSTIKRNRFKNRT